MKSANADEIFGFASDEIKSTHPPSRRISPNEVGFHRRRRFHPPAREDLVENDRFLPESVVFWCERRDLNPYGVNHTPLKRARLPVPPLSHIGLLTSNGYIIHKSEKKSIGFLKKVFAIFKAAPCALLPRASSFKDVWHRLGRRNKKIF